MSESMLVVIAYDTPDDRRRRRIVRLLDDVGDRVQYSIFEAWLTDVQLEQVWQRLLQVVDSEKDKLQSYRLCSYCRSAGKQAGNTTSSKLPELWIV